MPSTLKIDEQTCLNSYGRPMQSWYSFIVAQQWVTVTLAMLGKVGAAAAFAVIYVWAAELFPTVVRNAGMGASSSCARIGSMLSPYIAYLVSVMCTYWEHVVALHRLSGKCNAGMGASSSCARIGSMLSPYIAYLVSVMCTYWEHVVALHRLSGKCNAGMGANPSCARFGNMLSPYIAYLVSVMRGWVPARPVHVLGVCCRLTSPI